MKVVFLGTPDFAVNSLNALVNSRHKVLAVVTQPDRPVGRKGEITPSPVKVCALKNGLKVLQYDKISKEGVEDLKSLAPDIMITCAFGQILSEDVLSIAPHGVINVHGSLLPKYRGAAPIQYAVLNGEKETGVTIMQTERGLDCGDIISVEKTEIGDNETAGDLFERLSDIGADLLVKTLDRIESGDVMPVKQDESLATVVKTIKKSDALIDWSKDSSALHNFVRGMNPWPVAYTFFKGKILKIFKAESVIDRSSSIFGEVLRCDDELVIACGDGALKILELQLEGSKRMSASDFLRGRRLSVGDVLKNG